MDGYENINIRFNENMSMLQLLHINVADSPEIEDYFYREYFLKEIDTTLQNIQTKRTKNKNNINNTENENIQSILTQIESWKKTNNANSNKMKKLKKADLFRIQHMANNITSQRQYMFEFLLLEFCDKIVMSLFQKTTDYGLYLYTLIHFKKVSISKINKYVVSYVDLITSIGLQYTNITEVFHRAPEFIERNKYLLKYEDISLFAHQKQLFSLFKGHGGGDTPKLVLYMAPTGTGKTMSPLGLSNGYKVIFVCVARHVGLALAKSAISMGKKVAFAFGCDTSSDIRLHYYAAVSYSVHRKSGGIHKVDNSIGTNVEIMICDVKSYITAMHYMLAFNDEQQIVTYWDEPTITMDYEEHGLHELIHNNWLQNKISKIVLSCATLPKEHEIMDTIADFKLKFENAEVHTISSYDCRKSISIVNKDGKCALPHTLFRDYAELMDCVAYCQENKTLLRYFDLEEIVRFVEYVCKNGFVTNKKYMVGSYFANISDITMNSIKVFYLDILSHMEKDHWSTIYTYMMTTQDNKFRDMSVQGDSLRKIKSVDNSLNLNKTNASNTMSFDSAPAFGRTKSMAVLDEKPAGNVIPNPTKGILLTTVDAHTLTDGPTIFLVEDVEKVGKFYIQQSKIPDKVFKEIMDKIRENETIQKKLYGLEKTLEDKLGSDIDKEKKMGKENYNKEARAVMSEISRLQEMIRIISMDSKYIPNMKQHQELWIPNGEIIQNAFIPMIDDSVVKEIMSVDVDNNMKMLLLLGIGVFTNQPNIQYMEIMKRLAMEQKLYMIIAQSDYIYGTNYQFCHGFIGKDLTNMTQQKTIQAMGRIGRSNIQQEYTVRFRDDSVIMNLFSPKGENMEATNMSKLFSAPEGYYDFKKNEEEDEEPRLFYNDQFYKIFGISRESPKMVIKKAYRKLARVYHPDRARDAAQSENVMHMISHIYEILMDDKKRNLYNQCGLMGIMEEGIGPEQLNILERIVLCDTSATSDNGSSSSSCSDSCSSTDEKDEPEEDDDIVVTEGPPCISVQVYDDEDW
jgi:hypothetical protein